MVPTRQSVFSLFPLDGITSTAVSLPSKELIYGQTRCPARNIDARPNLLLLTDQSSEAGECNYAHGKLKSFFFFFNLTVRYMAGDFSVLYKLAWGPSADRGRTRGHLLPPPRAKNPSWAIYVATRVTITYMPFTTHRRNSLLASCRCYCFVSSSCPTLAHLPNPLGRSLLERIRTNILQIYNI